MDLGIKGYETVHLNWMETNVCSIFQKWLANIHTIIIIIIFNFNEVLIFWQMWFDPNAEATMEADVWLVSFFIPFFPS